MFPLSYAAGGRRFGVLLLHLSFFGGYSTVLCMFCTFEFIQKKQVSHYNIDKSNKEEINMYTLNTREEIKAMQSIMPLKTFGALRVAEKTGHKTTSAVHTPNTAGWVDELRSRSVLPVDNTFLVRLYRCA